MTSLGSILTIVAIGGLVYFMMRKGGGCCGGGHDVDKDHGPNKKELGDHTQGSGKDQPRGGCCG